MLKALGIVRQLKLSTAYLVLVYLLLLSSIILKTNSKMLLEEKDHIILKPVFTTVL